MARKRRRVVVLARKNAKAAARHLGVSQIDLEALERTGQLQANQTPGGAKFYDIGALNRLRRRRR